MDTNVFIYAHDPRDPRKQALAQELIERLVAGHNLVTSTQVLNEICAVLLRKNFAVSQTVSNIRDLIEDLSTIAQISVVTADTTMAALAASEHNGLSWFDALIWAAAKQEGVSVLYSEDFQDGRSIQGVTFTNPFAE